LRTVVVLGICCVFVSLVSAIPLQHYDFRSLVVESDAIVAARALEDPGWYCVEKAYHGNLARNDRVSVTNSPLYCGMEHSNNVVLFLRNRESGWEILPAGAYEEHNKELFQFWQNNNPGLYSIRGPLEYDRATLEIRIVEALRWRALLAERLTTLEPEARVNGLLNLLGARKPLPPCSRWNELWPRYGQEEDVVGERVAVEVAKVGDQTAIVDALSRLERWPARESAAYDQLEMEAMLLLAGTDTFSPELRGAAVRTLAVSPNEKRDARATLSALGRLISDRQAEIRIAVAFVWSQYSDYPWGWGGAVKIEEIRGFIERAWQVERDPEVRMALSVAVGCWGLENAVLRGNRPHVEYMMGDRGGEHIEMRGEAGCHEVLRVLVAEDRSTRKQYRRELRYLRAWCAGKVLIAFSEIASEEQPPNGRYRIWMELMEKASETPVAVSESSECGYY
jgi:hypothetical protein